MLFAGPQGRIPDKAGRGKSQWITPGVRIAAGVGIEILLEIGVGDGGVGPLVTVGRVRPAGVGVVEQNKLLGEGMFVRRDFLAEQAERPETVSLREIAEVEIGRCGFPR